MFGQVQGILEDDDGDGDNKAGRRRVQDEGMRHGTD